MATDLERLVVQLSADIKGYENAMRKAQGVTNSATKSIERQFARSNKNITAGFSGLSRALAGAFAATTSLRGAQQLVDTATRIQNALKVAGLSGEQLTKVYDRLFESAQRNAAPLESLVDLYSRASLSAKELGASQQQLLAFTDNVALALRVNGKSAAESSGALMQLSQLLGSGTVRAEEFNSVQEAALPILQAVAAGLKEAGGSVSTLRGLVIDGKVSSEAFFLAFEAGSDILREKVAGSALTVAQAFQRIENALVDAVGKLNETTGASRILVGQLGELAAVISALSNVFAAAADGPIGSFIGKLSQLNDLIKQVLPGFNALGLLDEGVLNQIADGLGPAAGPSNVKVAGGKQAAPKGAIDRRIDEAFGVRDQVSIQDAPARSRSTGTGGSRSKAASDAEREAAAVKELIADLEYERSLIGMTDAEREKANALRQAGAAATDAQKEKIAELVDAISRESAAQEALQNLMQDINDLGRDALGGFISDLREGTSAADALKNALDKIADRLLNMGLDALFSGGFGGIGRGGLLGGSIIPGILHSGGVAGSDGYGHGRSVSPGVFSGAPRMHSGGVAGGLRAGEVPAILQRGEMVLPKGFGRSGGGYGGRDGGGQTIVINAPMNAPGADPAQLARLSQSVNQLAKSVPQMVDNRTRDRQVRSVRA